MTTDSAALTALIDRAAIENLLADYYAHIGEAAFDFGAYFTADGVLDVNGVVAKGADGIKALYVRAGGGAGVEPPEPKDPNSPPKGRSHMQMTNLKVEVKGDTAVAEFFFSSLRADTLISPPRVGEYGRERTELVKQNGRWLIKSRVCTTYGGMPEQLLKSYVRR